MIKSITSLVGGLLTVVIGLILSTIVNTQAAASGSNAKIGSFAGAQSLNDLVPLVFIAAIVMVGVGLMALGGAGLAGKGPLSR